MELNLTMSELQEFLSTLPPDTMAVIAFTEEEEPQ